MKTIKLLLCANRMGSWKTLPDKIAELERWAKDINLQIDLRYTIYEDIPFSVYNPLIDQYNKKLISTQCQGVNPTWYDENISSKAKSYDIVLFALTLDQWDGRNARGWRADNNYGPIETQIGADERESEKGHNRFLMFAKHEIAHALYVMTGQTDRVHEFYYTGDLYCDKIWSDLKFEEPREYGQYHFYWNFIYNFLKRFMSQETKTSDLKLTNFCLAIQKHEGWFVNSRSFRNNNPGNLKYCGQKLATGQDDKNFAIFQTYQDGFNTLKDMIRRAATGLSKVYSPEDTLIQFFNKYAPSFDDNDPNNYAKVVASQLGVDTGFKIKNLIQ